MKSKFNFILALTLLSSFAFINMANAQVSQDFCKKEIRTDRIAAQDCAKKAQDQGKTRGFNVSCVAKDVMLGFTDPNTQLNYSLEISCTVNGFGGFAAELLAGWNSPNGVINAGWDNLQRELDYRSNPNSSSSSSDWVRTMQDGFARVRLYDPCTHQFFGDNDGVNDGNVNNVMYSVGEIRLFLADQRVAGVPSWVAGIVNNAPRVSPVLSQALAGGLSGNILNNYSPTSRAVAVGPNNVPAVLLSSNYSPSCSNVSLTSAPASVQPNTQTTPTSTQTPSGAVSQPVFNYTNNVTGTSATNESLQKYINSLLSLVASLRSQLQSISPSTGFNSSYTSTSGGGNITSSTQTLLTRNLGFGDSGADVLILVQLLIREGFLASSQNVFNQRVLDAVMKFQEAHAAEILVPEGLTQGTGFVGPRTREVVNNILRQSAF